MAVRCVTLSREVGDAAEAYRLRHPELGYTSVADMVREGLRRVMREVECD